MAKPRLSNYNKTIFIRRILELQAKHGYTDRYVIDNVKDSHDVLLTTNLQTYGKWKSGERHPSDMEEAILAFAKFYDVSTDYLLNEEEKSETPQIKSVNAATGLDSDAIRNIMDFNSHQPDIMKMINVFFSNADGEALSIFVNLYNQLYSDYKDTKDEGIKDSDYNIEKMQNRFLHTQSAYNQIKALVLPAMASYWDKQILQDEDEQEYYHSDEYINSLPVDTGEDYILEYEDGTVKHLRRERH